MSKIVKFYLLDTAHFELWQEGTFDADWMAGTEGSHGMSISSQFSSSELEKDANVLMKMVKKYKNWDSSKKRIALETNIH